LYVPGANPAMGGNSYALATVTGQRLWRKDLRGAIAGGVITYSTGGAQKVAVAVGFTNILWPTKVVTGKIVILARLAVTRAGALQVLYIASIIVAEILCGAALSFQSWGSAYRRSNPYAEQQGQLAEDGLSISSYRTSTLIGGQF
jgi:hypothetical protein